MKKDTLSASAIVLIVIALFTTLIVHYNNPGNDIIKNSLSNYTRGNYGWISYIGSVCFATVHVIIFIMLKDYASWMLKTSSRLFLLCSMCLILVVVFNVDGNGRIESPTEFIHVFFSTLLFVAWPPAILFSGKHFNKPMLQFFSYFVFAVTLFLTIYGVCFAATNLSNNQLENNYLGLVEKADILLIAIWMVIFLVNKNKMVIQKAS